MMQGSCATSSAMATSMESYWSRIGKEACMCLCTSQEMEARDVDLNNEAVWLVKVGKGWSNARTMVARNYGGRDAVGTRPTFLQ